MRVCVVETCCRDTAIARRELAWWELALTSLWSWKLVILVSSGSFVSSVSSGSFVSPISLYLRDPLYPQDPRDPWYPCILGILVSSRSLVSSVSSQCSSVDIQQRPGEIFSIGFFQRDVSPTTAAAGVNARPHFRAFYTRRVAAYWYINSPLARHGLHSGGTAVDACAYVMRAVERVMFTKFYFKERVFIYL